MTPEFGSRADVAEALRDLATAIEVPPAPDYAAQVGARLAQGPARPPRRRFAGPGRRPFGVSGARRFLLAAAAAILLAAGTVVAVPASRHALASFLGFTGIEIRTAPSEPGPSESTASAAPSGTPVPPVPLDMGRRVTLAVARHAAGGRLRLPSGAAAPSRVFLRRDRAAVVVTLAFRTAPGLAPTANTGYALILTEIFDAGEPLFEKLLHTGAVATEVHVRGRPGVYVRGPQDIVNVVHRGGGSEVVYDVTPRASATSLIWADGKGTYRLEADFSAGTAVRLAETLH